MKHFPKAFRQPFIIADSNISVIVFLLSLYGFRILCERSLMPNIYN